MDSLRILALSADASQFDQTWGTLLRSYQQSYKLHENLIEFSKEKSINCDILIIDNVLKASIKGATLIGHLRKIGKLSFKTIVLLTTYSHEQLYSFKNIDIRPDIVMPMPFQNNMAMAKFNEAKSALYVTQELRKAFTDNDLDKIIGLRSNFNDTKFECFAEELLAEAYCKLGKFENYEASLHKMLEKKIWPSFILAREYSKQGDTEKFSKLIKKAKEFHGNDIGLSYLFLQGNVMLQSAEIGNEPISLSKQNDYFQAPEYLYWLSKFEYKRQKFKNALVNHLAYIKDKESTSLEDIEDYKLLSKYTESYLSYEDMYDIELIKDTVQTFKRAKNRNILDDTLNLSSIKFDIRLNMLNKNYDEIGPLVIEAYTKYPEILAEYPVIMKDIIYTISNSVELSKLKRKLLKEKAVRKLLLHSARNINQKIATLLEEAKVLISNDEHSAAELKLTKVLKNDQGNIDASFMLADINVHFASLHKNKDTKKRFVNMAMQILEDANNPISDWERNRKAELNHKMAELV